MKLSTLIRHSLLNVLMTVVVSRFLLGPLHAATFQGIGDLPGGLSQSFVEAVSGDGTTVFGRSWDDSGIKPVRWDNRNGMVGLVEGSFVFANAGAPSADGHVSGVRLNRLGGLWTEETGFVDLPEINVGALSADGSIAAGATRFGNGAEAVLWTSSDGAQTLGRLHAHHGLAAASGISADGSVVSGFSCGPCEAFRWTKETGMVGLGDLTENSVSDSRAEDISADGNIIVGTATQLDGSFQAFRWTSEGGMQGLGSVEGSSLSESQASAANADGSVIVGFITDNVFSGCPAGSCESFIWNGDHGMRRLEDVLVDDHNLGAALAGWTLTSATDISDDGLTVVGDGINPRGMREGWIARLDLVVTGDYNGNGELDVNDLNLQAMAIQSGDLTFDENGDGQVDLDDRKIWIKDYRGTWFGDANLDGEFKSGDLVFVFDSGKYENFEMASWSEGDWDGNRFFDSGDLVAAFVDGGYETGPAPATSGVPEPTSIVILMVSVIGIAIRGRQVARVETLSQARGVTLLPSDE